MTFKEKLLQNIFVTRSIASLITLLYNISRIFNLNFNNNNVLIISLHKLGDTVLTIPSVKLLNKYFKKEIYILCFETSKEIYKNYFNDLEYVTVKKDQILFGDRILNNQIIKEINKISPETIIDLTGSIASASVIFRIKVPNIIGINEDFYRGIYSKFIPIRKTPHLLDIYLDVVRSIAPDLVEDSVKEFPIQIKKEKQILIHPFAGWAAKEWSFNKFLLLYEKLIKQFECKFIFEKNRLKLDMIHELQKMNINYIETKTIEELKCELSNCSLLISNDSGPIHIASMLGVPTFGIYGPTHPAFHVPLGKFHRYINKSINCSPKGTKYCFTGGGRFCPTYDCMHQLTVEEVIQAVCNFINELNILTKIHPKQLFD